jgi:hypothetical protein
VVDVDASKLPRLAERPPPKAARYVLRVTPLESKGMKMRVAVDLVETHADGTRLVRCGAADDEPLLQFEGPSAYGATDAGAAAGGARELRECRTFAGGASVWALGFEADTAGDVEARWVVEAANAKLDEAHRVLDHKAVPAEAGRTLPRAAQVERYGYTLLGSTQLDTSGYLVAARYNGKLRLAKRAADWGPGGNTTDFWFGSGAGMPALAVRDARVVVLVPLSGKLDLYGAAFPVEAQPPKPEPIALAEPVGVAALSPDAERTAVSAAIASHGQVVAAFLDGKPGKRRPRLAVLSEALKPLGPAFEPLGTGDADVSDVKVLTMPDDRILVATLVARPGGSSVEGAVLSCGLGTPVP